MSEVNYCQTCGDVVVGAERCEDCESEDGQQPWWQKSPGDMTDAEFDVWLADDVERRKHEKS